MTTKPTEIQVAALKEYAEANGRTWKAKLLEDWYNGRIMTPGLQQIRNTFGPSWLLRHGQDAIK